MSSKILNDRLKQIQEDNLEYHEIIKLLNKYTNLIVDELTPLILFNLTNYFNKVEMTLLEENKLLKEKLDKYNSIFDKINSSFLGFFVMKRLRKKYPEIEKFFEKK